jgi:hypothetical protein
MESVAITAPAEQFQQLFNVALFGSNPLFVDNWIAFQKDKALIADLSMNALLVYAEFKPEFFPSYQVTDSEATNFAVSSELQKICRKAFSPTEEVNFVIEGLEFSLESKTRRLSDKLKKASNPHVIPAQFPAKVVDSKEYGLITTKVADKLDQFNKVQMGADSLLNLVDTTASHISLNIKKDSFTANQEDQDSTWKLDEFMEQKTSVKIDYVKDMSIRVAKQNFRTALAIHTGVVNLLCEPTIVVMTSSTPAYRLLTFVGTAKASKAAPATPAPTEQPKATSPPPLPTVKSK